VRIDVAREGAERAVRHPHRHGGRVLERIRHRQQQDVHEVRLSLRHAGNVGGITEM
jgi:hypothetical protein